MVDAYSVPKCTLNGTQTHSTAETVCMGVTLRNTHWKTGNNWSCM